MRKLKKFRVEIYREVSNTTTGYLYAKSKDKAWEIAEEAALEDEQVEIGDCTFIECTDCEEVKREVAHG